jgi:hypothetical protein
LDHHQLPRTAPPPWMKDIRESDDHTMTIVVSS